VCLALVLAWDRRRRLRPVALQSDEAGRLLAGMPEEQRMASWHLVTPGGDVTSAGAAFVPLFRLLRGGEPFAALADRYPRAAERAYRAVADRRSAFGRPLPKTLKQRADRLIDSRR
jgi:predicted DCC family thiol-disulfide oxidoreductase YuxK